MTKFFSALAVAIVLLGCWLAYEIGHEIVALYDEADSDIKLGVLTAGGSAAAFIINNAFQSSRERRARLFEAKRLAYEEFIEFFTSTVQRSGTDDEVDQEDMISAFREFTAKLMISGSAESINAFVHYQRINAGPPASSPRELFGRTEALLRALRKDLGHSDSSLKSLALTKLLLRGDDHASLD